MFSGWPRNAAVLVAAVSIAACTRDAGEPVAQPAGDNNFRIAYTTIESEDASAIHVMNSDGSDDRRLTELSSFAALPSFSPDGKQITYVAQKPLQVFVVGADGSDVRQVTKLGGSKTVPVFSPDGTQIAFTDEVDDRRFAIAVVPAAGGDPRMVVAPFVSADGPRPAFTPDGAGLVFDKPVGEVGSDYASHRVDIATGETTTMPIPAGREPNRLQYSPDGSKIVYQTAVKSGAGGIFVANADGSGARRVVVARDNDYLTPNFSPDGRKITYADEVPGGDAPLLAVFVVNVDGSDRRQITHPVRSGEENFAPGDVLPVWGRAA